MGTLPSGAGINITPEILLHSPAAAKPALVKRLHENSSPLKKKKSPVAEAVSFHLFERGSCWAALRSPITFLVICTPAIGT